MSRNLSKDPVSPELRQIETELDSFHRANPLMQLPFGIAAWYFMAFCEDDVFINYEQGRIKSIQDAAIFADRFVVHLKNAFLWLHNACPGGRFVQPEHDPRYYQAGWDLSVLSEHYDPFEWAFTYASRGLIDLSLHHLTIEPSKELFKVLRYEMYDRLAKTAEINFQYNIMELYRLVASSLMVDGSKFAYQLNPKVVANAMELLDCIVDQRYSLPQHWKLSQYSIGDFRRISKCLVTMSFLHYAARILAANSQCEGLGYDSSILVMSTNELTNRLARYSGCSTSVVTAFVEDLTYGSRGIAKPDPALQPLIQLGGNTYGIMPNLWINSSVERNFIVLMNRLPEERAIYSCLVGEKESLMKQWIVDSISIDGLRHFSGSVPGNSGYGDIDLALIDDNEKSCLFLELKWFVEPAEVREMIEKSEEIGKGISQLETLSELIERKPAPYFAALRIDASYRRFFAVASDSYIGMADVQNPNIPVVRHRHLVSRMNQLNSLEAVCGWMGRNEYLPVEGTHFETREKVWTVGRWSIKWYSMMPLVDSI